MYILYSLQDFKGNVYRMLQLIYFQQAKTPKPPQYHTVYLQEIKSARTCLLTKNIMLHNISVSSRIKKRGGGGGGGGGGLSTLKLFIPGHIHC